MVRTPACHAGGRGFESRRSRLSKRLQTATLRRPGGREWPRSGSKRAAGRPSGLKRAAAILSRLPHPYSEHVRYELVQVEAGGRLTRRRQLLGIEPFP